MLCGHDLIILLYYRSIFYSKDDKTTKKTKKISQWEQVALNIRFWIGNPVLFDSVSPEQ